MIGMDVRLQMSNEINHSKNSSSWWEIPPCALGTRMNRWFCVGW